MSEMDPREKFGFLETCGDFFNKFWGLSLIFGGNYSELFPGKLLVIFFENFWIVLGELLGIFLRTFGQFFENFWAVL